MRSEAFSKSAAYYDMLYRDKNYCREAAYINSLLQHYAPKVKTILEFGCGTGRHTKELAALGSDVLGVDISHEMLNQAEQLKVPGVTFMCGDMRSFHAGRTFDAVIAMFHVVSYLTTDSDLENAFKTVAEHLQSGGIFLFDCWYGPAVLTDKPAVRILRISEDDLDLVRIAEPTIIAATSTVKVDYQMLLTDKGTGNISTFLESHTLRYLFQNEIIHFLKQAGLLLEYSEEFLSGRPLGFTTWYGCFLARKP
jgi:SAM-dependent methyltransferase